MGGYRVPWHDASVSRDAAHSTLRILGTLPPRPNLPGPGTPVPICGPACGDRAGGGFPRPKPVSGRGPKSTRASADGKHRLQPSDADQTTWRLGSPAPYNTLTPSDAGNLRPLPRAAAAGTADHCSSGGRRGKWPLTAQAAMHTTLDLRAQCFGHALDACANRSRLTWNESRRRGLRGVFEQGHSPAGRRGAADDSPSLRSEARSASSTSIPGRRLCRPGWRGHAQCLLGRGTMASNPFPGRG